MARPRYLRWAIRSLVVAAATAILAALVIDWAPGRDVDPAERVVMSYVKARRAGDAGKACEQLSGAERRELVARVSRSAPVSNVADYCEHYVLQPSRFSDLTRPALATFRVVGAEARRFADDVRLVRPRGFNLPVLEVWKRDGEWKIDMQAAEGTTFVEFCRREGAAVSECECVFDSARSRDPRVLDRTDGVMDLIRDFESGRRRALFANLVRRCDGDGPRRPSA